MSADQRFIRPIETRFDGYLFRSRTEAKWAMFFREAGIEYQYEPQSFILWCGGYIPDFWLPTLGCWLEVKGKAPTEIENRRCDDLSFMTNDTVLLAVGPPSRRQQRVLSYLCAMHASALSHELNAHFAVFRPRPSAVIPQEAQFHGL